MSYLYLIRHPHTRVDPTAPASQWRLTEDGQAQVRALVAAPFWNHATAVYTSEEYKTTVVGEAVHAAYGLPVTPVAGLGEARRDQWVGGDAFLTTQQAFFARPDVPPVPAWEPAQAAETRFAAAIDGVLSRHPAADALAVVAHATVLTLYLSHLQPGTPRYTLWRSIGFAEALAIDRATMRPLTPFLAAPFDGLPPPAR